MTVPTHDDDDVEGRSLPAKLSVPLPDPPAAPTLAQLAEMEAHVARLEMLRTMPELSREVVEATMRGTPLAHYLGSAGNDPELGLRLAKADLAYVRALRQAGWQTVTERRWARLAGLLKVVAMPLTLVVAAALLGNWVAVTLQQKANVFQSNLERLREGERLTASLTADFRAAQWSMSHWEVWGGGVDPRNELNTFFKQLEHLRPLARHDKNSSQVLESIDRGDKSLNAYVDCLSGKKALNRDDSSKPSCTDGLGNDVVNAFRAIGGGFSREVRELATD